MKRRNVKAVSGPGRRIFELGALPMTRIHFAPHARVFFDDRASDVVVQDGLPWLGGNAGDEPSR